MSRPRPIVVMTLLPLLLVAGCALRGAGHPAEGDTGAGAPVPLVAGPAHYRCGELAVVLRPAADGATLEVAGEALAMEAVPTASGAKLVARDDPGTSFWSKGEGALLELKGLAQPECRRVAAQSLYRAVGNEPAWRLDVTDTALVLLADYGETRVSAPAPVVESGAGFRHYQAQADGRELAVMVTPRICVDSMSGMTHPDTVELRWDGRALRGCGGEPASLLQGAPWQVQELDGAAVGAVSISLAFDAQGRIGGTAACNRYTGQYRLSGEGLRLSRVAATRMACAPELMGWESRFLGALERVRGFAIDADGALVLRDGAGAVLRARRRPD